MKVKVKFFICQWDNYQGSSGKIIELERIFTLNDNILLIEVQDNCIELINHLGYFDSWGEKKFSGKGLISITI